MLRAVLTRRNKVSRLLVDTQSLPPHQQTNDRMCFCYIIVFASVEYMIESLIRGWINHNVRKHKYPYPQKPRVDYIISVLNDLAEFNLERNNGIRYGRICELIQKLAGPTSKTSFKASVDAFPGGSGALDTAIKRVETTRHRIAHGQLLPDEVSPNLAELQKDFDHIYACLVENLNAALPRKY